MSASPKTKKTGKRYTSEEKEEILSFVAQYNAENGRGGQTAAGKKFGISALSLTAWKKAASLPEAGGAKRGRKPGSKNRSVEGSFTGRLASLNTLAGQIDKAEGELSRMKAKFQSLLAAL